MRIRDLREDNNLTQEQVAKYLHVKQNTYSQYENEQRQLPKMVYVIGCFIHKMPLDFFDFYDIIRFEDGDSSLIDRNQSDG